MVAILGPPPLDFLQRSEKSERFWDRYGRRSFLFKASNNDQYLTFCHMSRKMDWQSANSKCQPGNCRAATRRQGEDELPSLYEEDAAMEA